VRHRRILRLAIVLVVLVGASLSTARVRQIWTVDQSRSQAQSAARSVVAAESIARLRGVPAAELAPLDRARIRFGRRCWVEDLVAAPAARGQGHGAALLAAVGAGFYPTVQDACAAAVSVGTAIRPDGERAAVYERSYAVYRALYPALKSQFVAVASLER